MHAEDAAAKFDLYLRICSEISVLLVRASGSHKPSFFMPSGKCMANENYTYPFQLLHIWYNLVHEHSYRRFNEEFSHF